MSKEPIIIANWRGNVGEISEAKNIIKDIHKEFSSLLNYRNKLSKKKPKKKDLSFYLSLPSPFIYPIQNFVKENKNFKNITVGAQNFDEIEKTNKNAKTTFSQIKSVGAKFILLNNDGCGEEYFKKFSSQDFQDLKKKENNLEIFKKNEENKIKSNILLERLNNISKKIKENKEDPNKEKDFLENTKNDYFNENKKHYEKNINLLEEKIKISLLNKIKVVLIIKIEDINELIFFIERVIKNIHYNLFENFIICYKPLESSIEINNLDIANCQEKVILIRRTVANMFGIDNAKKIKIIYSGRINEKNVLEIIEDGKVDGVLIDEESTYSKQFAKILIQTA